VTAVQTRARWGSIQADLATLGPEAIPENASACRTGAPVGRRAVEFLGAEGKESDVNRTCPVFCGRRPDRLDTLNQSEVKTCVSRRFGALPIVTGFRQKDRAI
jgi:hypothetical protein